jgi:hypothetical protein
MAAHDIQVFETIDTFTGWGVLALTIPKAVRERAVDLAIDIEIVSVLREQYLSYASVPANGSYGKVVLVLQNFAEIEIELSQPRQRVYLWHSAEAYANRYAIELLDLNLLAHLATQTISCAILANLLGACTPQPEPDFPNVLWAETPLIEVYVKSFYGTVFKIEVSHKRFTPYQMLSTGQILQMESGWSDGEKDSGLPLSGSQPQIVEDEDDPYNGFPSPSPFEELGGFFNGKVYNADIPNSDNEPVFNRQATATDEGYYLRSTISYVQFSPCRIVTSTVHVPCLVNGVINVRSQESSSACGFSSQLTFWSVTTSSYGEFGTYITSGTLSGTVLYGLLPADIIGN